MVEKKYRHEKKYTIDWHEFQIINNKLKYLLNLDVHCPKEGYEVKSLYFDNPYNYAMTQKIEGDELRHKFRMRVYNNDFSNIKLEKKSKHNLMTNKESITISKEVAKNIIEGKFSFLEENTDAFCTNFLYKLKHDQYKPKVIVKYNRIAYTYPLSNLRITFDFIIKKSNAVDKFFGTENNYMEVWNPNQVIMEIKFDHLLPTFVRSIIQSPNIMATSSSKYVAARVIYS